MRAPAIALLSLCLAVLAATSARGDYCASSGTSRWSQDTMFVIGMYYGPNASSPDSALQLASFRRAVAAGFNLVVEAGQLTQFAGFEGRRERVLELADATGLNVIVADNHFSLVSRYSNYVGFWGRCGYARRGYAVKDSFALDREKVLCSEAGCGGNDGRDCIGCIFPHYLRHKHRKAIYGYYVCDEPMNFAGDQAEVKRRVATIGGYDPTRLAYFNLHPYGGPGESTLGYARSMTTDADPARTASVVSYDIYPFAHANDRDRNYYRIMSDMREAAGDRPTWATILTRGVDTPGTKFDRQTPAHVRLSASNALAYGVHGLTYYSYQCPPDQGGLVDETTDAPSDLFDTVRRINFYARAVFGPMAFRSRHVGAFHKTGDSIPARDLLANTDATLIADLSDASTLVGLFQDTVRTGNAWLMVANKATSAITTTIELNGDYGSRVSVSRRTMLDIGSLADTSFVAATAQYDSGRRRTSLRVSLAAGEGRLYRVSGVPIAAFGRVRRPGT